MPAWAMNARVCRHERLLLYLYTFSIYKALVLHRTSREQFYLYWATIRGCVRHVVSGPFRERAIVVKEKMSSRQLVRIDGGARGQSVFDALRIPLRVILWHGIVWDIGKTKPSRDATRRRRGFRQSVEECIHKFFVLT